MRKKDKKYLNYLAQVAEDSEKFGNARIAAMIVHKNMPVAHGTNQDKTHPLQAQFAKNDEAIYLHAEISAISRAIKTMTAEELKKSTLYICRIKETETGIGWGLAKPCCGCEKAINHFGIGRVVWSCEGNNYEGC